jgi:hypothetical protein
LREYRKGENGDKGGGLLMLIRSSYDIYLLMHSGVTHMLYLIDILKMLSMRLGNFLLLLTKYACATSPVPDPAPALVAT